MPYKGGRAFCLFCNETVIAVCGEINIHHWRHGVNSIATLGKNLKLSGIECGKKDFQWNGESL